MYDKTVRRRRTVLALLVVLALILLTAYFGESRGGALHSVQRGFLTVVAPIQDGANKALKPVRDLFSSFDDVLHAKSQNAELRKQVDKLRREVVAERIDQQSYGELLGMFHLDNQLSISDYRPVTATVVSQTPNIWYSTVRSTRATSAGVRDRRPRDQRRRPRRQGHRGRLRRRPGQPHHRQHDGRLARASARARRRA